MCATGKTRLPDLADGAEGDKVVDMSLENLGADLVSLLRTLFPNRRTAPALVLVGHSMVRESRTSRQFPLS